MPLVNDSLTRLENESLPATWLAVRLGTGDRRVDAMRRGGELLAVPGAGGEYRYPSWQFGPDGKALPAIPRIVQAARAAGLDDARLYEVMNMRLGLGSDRCLVDVLREGGDDAVVASVAQSTPR